MNGIWYYIIAFILIWMIVLIFKNKLVNYGLEIEFPLLMWKISRFRGFINRIANISPKFWKWFMNIGIVISFGLMIFITYSLLYSLQTLFETPSVSIIIPGVEIPGSPIYIPLGYGLFGLATVLIVHEFSHGILARVEKINIKSIGLLLFTILPGAFVEPDEEELHNSSRISKLRVYCAGSMANITLATIALIFTIFISSFAIPAAFDNNGMEIVKVMDNSPAEGVLKEGMVIESIDNHKINNYSDYVSIASNYKPDQNVTISTDSGSYTFELDKHPDNSSKGYVGIQTNIHYEISNETNKIFGSQIPWVLFNLLELFKWIFFLNLGVGSFNLLPIKPLDGGHMLETLLSYKVSKKHYKPVMKIISIVLVAIILFSIIFSMVLAI